MTAPTRARAALSTRRRRERALMPRRRARRSAASASRRSFGYASTPCSSRDGDPRGVLRLAVRVALDREEAAGRAQQEVVHDLVHPTVVAAEPVVDDAEPPQHLPRRCRSPPRSRGRRPARASRRPRGGPWAGTTRAGRARLRRAMTAAWSTPSRRLTTMPPADVSSTTGSGRRTRTRVTWCRGSMRSG